ncbi:MAG TPA: glycosyltransferase family 1 protein [Myxococcales bacterium]|nr:glycosyltransferase family 1 protein [Myxococcales bacterium]HIL02080.1 glycosyltransferase family 1 protein [Myxococcales bacterium]
MTRASNPSCRVLLLNERDPLHPKTGGAETHVYEIFRRLASRGYSIHHLSASFPGCRSAEDVQGIAVRRLGPLPLYYPRAIWQTARKTRAGLFDVVVECLNKVPYYSPAYSKAPVLALCHHLFGEVAFQQVPWPVAATVWTSERLIPALYRSRPVIAISESTRRDLITRGVPSENIVVSHPGIAPAAIRVDPDRVRGQGVIYVGRLEVYKKIDVMLRAMANLTDRFPETPIVIVGRGPARSSLETLAQELGLAERTRFAGFVDDAERDNLLAEARVCVCPSEKEGWGLTVMEANAVGTPVVASDADGLRDSVRHGETGYLVPEGNVEGFARRIGQLLDSDELSAKMSAASLEWANHFDWDRAADEMADAIENARSHS